MLPVLTAAGRNDLAVALATQTTEPSWGYWTETAGFTALGEHWPANTRSRDHHFFGAIVQWLYEDLAGLRAVAPGFGRIEFKPEIPTTGVDRVSASYESVRGTVAASWKRSATGLEMDVTVPPGASGRVFVPAARAGDVTEIGTGRSQPAALAPSVTVIGNEGDRVVFEVGSGLYRFRVAARPASAGAATAQNPSPARR
jgi:alpha-L-rhamnosidase